MTKLKLKDILEKVVDNRGKTPNVVETGIPLLEVNAISNNNKYPNYSVIRKYITQDTYDTMRSGNPKENDILIGTVGSIGTIGMMDSTKGAVAQNLIALRTKNEINPHWLYYYLIYRMPDILNLNIGGVQPSIKVPHLLDLDIEVPDKKTQDMIADKMMYFDEKIKTNIDNIQKLELLSSKLYEKCIMNGYDEYKLEDVATFSVGGDKPKDISNVKTDDYVYPIYSNSIVDDGIFGYTNVYKVDKPSVTVSARGTIGFLSLRKHKYFPIVRLISVFTKDNNIPIELLYLALQHINIIGTGSTQPQLTVPLFKDSVIKIPKINDISDIKDKVISMYDLVSLYKEENELLTELRNELLKPLMIDL